MQEIAPKSYGMSVGYITKIEEWDIGTKLYTIFVRNAVWLVMYVGGTSVMGFRWC